MAESLTAFPQLEQNLKDLISGIDPASFKATGAPGCSVSSCERYGMRCSLTVAVTKEEAESLQALVTKNASFFRNNGCAIRQRIYRLDPVTGRHFLRSKRRPFRQLNTLLQNLRKEKGWDLGVLASLTRVCVFSMGDGSCALQKLSQSEGHHKWYYKPVNCWKYPLSIADGQLGLGDKTSFPYFPCNKSGSIPTMEALSEELDFLGKIIGRDLLQEIRGL